MIGKWCEAIELRNNKKNIWDQSSIYIFCFNLALLKKRVASKMCVLRWDSLGKKMENQFALENKINMSDRNMKLSF